MGPRVAKWDAGGTMREDLRRPRGVDKQAFDRLSSTKFIILPLGDDVCRGDLRTSRYRPIGAVKCGRRFGRESPS
jgi:hypothetical protein